MKREFLLVGMYEAREIPAGWQHPKDEHGIYIPLLPFGYRLDDDERAPADHMMPPPLGDIEIVAYESCSEGTPISPAFPNTSDGKLGLCNWCAANEKLLGKQPVDGEAWAAILFGDASIDLDGTVRAG